MVLAPIGQHTFFQTTNSYLGQQTLYFPNQSAAPVLGCPQLQVLELSSAAGGGIGSDPFEIENWELRLRIEIENWTTSGCLRPDRVQNLGWRNICTAAALPPSQRGVMRLSFVHWGVGYNLLPPRTERGGLGAGV